MSHRVNERIKRVMYANTRIVPGSEWAAIFIIVV